MANKNEIYLENQRELIRAEERIKFERNLIQNNNENQDKIREIRDELFVKGKPRLAPTDISKGRAAAL